jgi:hypothetical protein
MTFRDIVALHPLPASDYRRALVRCAEECLDCGASCTACADASLSEHDLEELIGVIRVCLDCADVCEATARIATRQTRSDIRLVRATIEACAAACVACAEECDRHAAHHEHCRICADICRRCKAACDEALDSLREAPVTNRGGGTVDARSSQESAARRGVRRTGAGRRREAEAT